MMDIYVYLVLHNLAFVGTLIYAFWVGKPTRETVFVYAVLAPLMIILVFISLLYKVFEKKTKK